LNREVSIDDNGRRAWQELYEQNAADLLRYLVKLTGYRETGSELLQETFARGMRAGLDGVQSRRGWLFRIATNLARDWYRAKPHRATEELTGCEIDDRPVFDVEVDLIHRALSAIPFDDATALLLRHDAGFSRAETAAHQGVAEEAMKSRLRRAKQRFMDAYFREQRGEK
jgi:RNA polymerase sigma-70 factor, ECF subfamily